MSKRRSPAEARQKPGSAHEPFPEFHSGYEPEEAAA
jgi:hypothetical protein